MGVVTAFVELNRDADAKAANVAGKGASVVHVGAVGRGGILGIVAGHGLQHDGAILNSPSHGAGVVEGPAEGEDAVAADEAIGGFVSYDAAVGGGAAYGAAGAGTHGAEDETGGHGSA